MNEETIKKATDTIVEKTAKEVEAKLDDILAGKYATVDQLTKLSALLKEKNTAPDAKKSIPFSEWIRSAREGSLVKKGLTEGVDSAGGYLVPPEYSNQIFQVQQKFTSLANKAMNITVGRDSFKGISLANDIQVSWIDEGATIPEHDISFKQPVVTIKKLGVLVKLSNELIEDSQANLDPLLNALVARAILKELDNQLINGTGAPFTGVLNETNIVNLVSSAALADVINYDDIVDVESAVSSDLVLNSSFAIHRTIAGILKKKKDSTGRPLGIVDPKAKTIDEIPYIVSERMPHDVSASKPVLLYGDWQNVIVAKRKTLTLQVLREKYSDSDQTGLKFIARYGIKTMAPEAFVKLTTAAS